MAIINVVLTILIFVCSVSLCVIRRKVILAKQNYRCAGCGAKVETGQLYVALLL